MRAAMYYGNHKLEIEDIPEPSPGEGQVKVRVSRNGICGTDLHEYYDGPIFIPPDQPHPLTGKAMPLVIGHEFSGMVTEVGAWRHRRQRRRSGHDRTRLPMRALSPVQDQAATTCAPRWASTA